MNERALLERRKSDAQAWFEALQTRLIEAIEALEAECPDGTQGPAPGSPPGRFTLEPWRRVDRTSAPGGGGRMATLRGRLFEKIAAHASTVYGTLAPEFAKRIPGAEANPRFWASGVSAIAHPWNPHVPAVHMNTRFVVTRQAWFGGGADLTPMLEARRRADDPDAVLFHQALRGVCQRHPAVANYKKQKAWCDEYFFLPHRGEPRGVGGVFFDRLNSAGDAANSAWEADFAFVRDLGETFVSLYGEIVRRNFAAPWSDAEREEQLVRRGRYVEFNLIYDRGTVFGLKTGGQVAAILSSLPPLARWP
jgi:coproporphyrinogen III oxidase